MASASIGEWMAGQRDALVWVEFDQYARKIFARGAPDWHSNADVFVNGISQALVFIKTGALSIDLLTTYICANRRC
jgi:hypothetical protein